MTEPVAPRISTAVGALGGAFMISRYSKSAGEANGLAHHVWANYFAGRAAPLGEVDADVVHAAFAFYPRPVVRDAWAARWAVDLPVGLAGERFVDACHQWSLAKLGGFPEAGRLADLLDLAVEAADQVGAPLFAGWRAARPGLAMNDDAGRAGFALFLMREHRMAMHAIAVRAAHLSPLEAILTGPGGVTNAAFFGWPEPYPDVAALTTKRAEAEAATDLLAEQPYAALTDAEGEELVGLAVGALQHSFG